MKDSRYFLLAALICSHGLLFMKLSLNFLRLISPEVNIIYMHSPKYAEFAQSTGVLALEAANGIHFALHQGSLTQTVVLTKTIYFKDVTFHLSKSNHSVPFIAVEIDIADFTSSRTSRVLKVVSHSIFSGRW